MLRLFRQGKVLQIKQPKDRPYLYKCVDSRIRHNSSKLEHYLAIVDAYIELKQPEFFVIEPEWSCYRPDVYCRVGNTLWCIEVQLSKVSNAKMQRKINEFVRSYRREEHDAKNMWIKSPFRWERLQAPESVDIKMAPIWEQEHTKIVRDKSIV